MNELVEGLAAECGLVLDSALRRYTEAIVEKCILVVEETRADRGLSGYKPHEDSHDDGWLDGCNESEWAIRRQFQALTQKPIAP